MAEEGFGQWIPGEKIQEGPNSTVYRATDSKRSAVLKVCPTRKRDKRSWQRFDREIRTLRKYSRVLGVMPLIDFSDLDDPEIQRLWYVMPEAVPFDQAFNNSVPQGVIAAVRDVAKTLEELGHEGVHHRDVKPANLFVIEGKHVVGDLGLVTTPFDLDPAITQLGERMGPANFMAPEMMEFDDSVDPAPADVYSVSKVLWTLLKGTTYPLPGPQRASDKTSLVAELKMPELAPLDGLIERATSNEPTERPQMGELVEVLESWLFDSDQDGSRDDLQEAIYAAKKRLADPQRKQAEVDRLRARSLEVFEATLVELEPAFNAMRQVGTRFSDSAPAGLADGDLDWPVGESFGTPQVLANHQQTSTVEVGSIPHQARMSLSIRVIADESEQAIVGMGLSVNQIPHGMGSVFSWADRVEGNAYSPSLSLAVTNLRDRLLDELVPAIRAFAETADPS